MKNIYQKKAVLHSLIWLGFYLILNTLTGNLADSLGKEKELISAIPNLALAAACFVYLVRTGISKEIGLLTKSTEKSSVMLYYIPLLALPFLNLLYGVNKSLTASQIFSILAMYTGVGFMEEIIFRGLMFKALEKKWNRYVTVAFISFTFAIGHIVSMATVGMSGADTVLQIINALVVGFMFMLIILASRNLTICIITHILYNTVANFSMVGYTHPEIIALNTGITLLYFVYLIFCTKNLKAYFRSAK